MTALTVVVNGAPREVPAGASVADVVAAVAASAAGVAAALNGEVVRRADWAATPLRDADRLEVLTAVQGG
ncbi:sulfur carrier protein ThiS [Actinomadura atramentaria]|uniref:sulfur carrier protein ThiS n=1 Tax=Actinomadura atramentaria TaxID=1990 RepID=UPI000364AF05|nr:sulfur carrier protein ThiS [Actinomadura atramentaria]